MNRLGLGLHLRGVCVIDSDDLFQHEMDIFAPCALGAVINDKSLSKLNTKVVAGAANNQLLDEQHGQALLDNGIIYAPDYVINSGGIIAVACGEKLGMRKREIINKVENIYNVTLDILSKSKHENMASNFIANHLAEKIMQQASQTSQTKVQAA